MEFLTDNYIWIIFIIVIILMIIIGYIAEKTNFGKKEFSKRKSSKAKATKENKQEEIETLPKTEIAPTIEKEVEQKPLETHTEPVEPKAEIPQEEVQFTDPLTDDMEISNDILETPYEQSNNEVLSVEEDLNTPFGEPIAYNEPPIESETLEDLNAPFGDFATTNESNIEENLNVPLTDHSYETSSYEMNQEDLNAPFGDELKYPTREEFNLDLPDIDSIKEDINTEAIDKNDDDDIWKF